MKLKHGWPPVIRFHPPTLLPAPSWLPLRTIRLLIHLPISVKDGGDRTVSGLGAVHVRLVCNPRHESCLRASFSALFGPWLLFRACCQMRPVPLGAGVLRNGPFLGVLGPPLIPSDSTVLRQVGWSRGVRAGRGAVVLCHRSCSKGF